VEVRRCPTNAGVPLAGDHMICADILGVNFGRVRFRDSFRIVVTGEDEL